MKRMTKSMKRNQGGFTLLEVMVVVAIIAILAKVALPAFTSTARKGEADAEVSAFFAELSMKEEQYKVDNGMYLSTGTSETDTFPAAPSTSLQTLGTLPATWTALRILPPTSTARCAFTVVAGNKTAGVIGTQASTTFGFTRPTVSWYYVLAHCDMDGSATTDSYYFASSVDSTIKKINAGK